MKRSLILGLFLTCFVILYPCGQVFGEPPYPTKPISLVAPVNPGGGGDMGARVISGYFSKKWGIQINVINKPGGATTIGTFAALSARPDGYTMLNDGHNTAGMAFLTDKLPYDWRKRVWCARWGIDPVLYLVRMDAPYKTLKELAEFIKKNPKEVRWGATGKVGIGFPTGIQFFRVNNISIDMVNQVAFTGEAPALAALAGGHIDFTSGQVGPSFGLVEGKKIRPLALIAEKRLMLLPEVPTVAESGYPMLDVTGWHGISGPPGLPKAVQEFWAKELEKASRDPEFLKMAEKIKKTVAYLGPKEFEAFAVTGYERFFQWAKEAGLR